MTPKAEAKRPGRKPTFSAEQAAVIRRLYEAGASSCVLADQFSTNQHMILRIVKRAGGAARTRSEAAVGRPNHSAAQMHTPEARLQSAQARREKYPTPTSAMLEAIGKAQDARRNAPDKPCIMRPGCGDGKHQHPCPVYFRQKKQESRGGKKA